MTQKKTATAVLATDQDKPFLFQHDVLEDGKSVRRTYKLPNAEEAFARVDAGAYIDAQLDQSDAAQIRFAVQVLVASGCDPEAMKALRAKSVPEFAEVLGKWIQSSGVSLGE